MARMMTGNEVPKTATNTAASAMPGKDMITSRTRMRISDGQRAAVAAKEPSSDATTSAMPVAHRPMSSDDRAPWRTREKMSRPMASVPMRCSMLGGCTGVPVARGS